MRMPADEDPAVVADDLIPDTGERNGLGIPDMLHENRYFFTKK